MGCDCRYQDVFVEILEEELLPAMGCTEPIAVAYCAAKAKETLGEMPDKVDVYCSGNIIKNVKAVTVPNSGDQIGIEVAAMLGIVGGDASKELEVVASCTPEDAEKTKQLVASGICTTHHAQNVDKLYIRVELSKGANTAMAEIKTRHTFISRVMKNGELIFSQPDLVGDSKADKSLLNLKDIYEFAKTVDVTRVQHLLDKQIECNTAISQEGLTNDWGASIGKIVLETYGDSWRARAAAAAAAGSDARMNGCAMPVVINSGSGNQGMTVSLPVIEYAKEIKASQEELYRALILANLVALLQKRYIGDLSAYCGACCAGCAAVCGVAYLDGADYETVGHIIINSSSAIGGMVCDGAKSSCAAKIAASVFSGFMGYEQAKRQKNFKPGEGMIVEDMEQTIANIGRMGREGMKETDVEILAIMIGK